MINLLIYSIYFLIYLFGINQVFIIIFMVLLFTINLFLNILKVEKINCEFDFEKKLNSHLFLEKIAYIFHFLIQNCGYD